MNFLLKKYVDRLKEASSDDYETVVQDIIRDVLDAHDILDGEAWVALREMIANPPPLPEWLREALKADKAEPGTPGALKPYWDIVELIERECGNTDGRIFSSVHQIISATIQSALKKRDAVVAAARDLPVVHASTCGVFAHFIRDCDCPQGLLRKALAEL